MNPFTKGLILSLPLLAMFSQGCFDANAIAKAPAKALSSMPDALQSSFFDLQANSLDGAPVSMDQFKGKKVIVLNVASKCGYTPQYADWEAFFRQYGAQVVVLGFPCNDFMSQEPGNASEIAAFCEKNYGVTFPMFEKVHVKGTDKSPVYQWLTDPAQNGWNSQEPSWNFCKYVIDEQGRLTHFFGSKIKPADQEFRQAVGL